MVGKSQLTSFPPPPTILLWSFPIAQWNLRWETTINTTKKQSFERGGLLLEVYLTISNRTTAERRWSPRHKYLSSGGLSSQIHWMSEFFECSIWYDQFCRWLPFPYLPICLYIHSPVRPPLCPSIHLSICRIYNVIFVLFIRAYTWRYIFLHLIGAQVKVVTYTDWCLFLNRFAGV